MTSASGGAQGGDLAELEALLEGARALIELDDAHAAKAQVVQAVGVIERLCGREPDPPSQQGRRLAERLAAIETGNASPEAGRLIAEVLRLGLRSAMLANDVESALPFGRAALAFANRLRLPVV
ncbi:MAG TPA: hypothetical protein VKY42_02160, partial [Trueperaceae bacterium]|nr:hypothetical protein [Trueperaceae bacterium]